MTCPLGSLKRPHYLRVADLYFDLLPRGMKAFDVEPRERYKRIGREVTYAPDVFAIFDAKPWVIEVQLKPRSRKEWAMKWRAANEYFDRTDRHFFQASWNRYAGKPFIPHFLVVTRQPAEIVESGFEVQGRTLTLTK